MSDRDQANRQASTYADGFSPVNESSPRGYPAILNESSGESHLVYELKQRMEYHLRKLLEIKQAIDAVNKI